MVTRNRLGPQGVDGPSVVVYHNPPSNDPRTPAAPANLRSSPPPQVYQIRGGGYAAACSLAWDPPGKDTDGNEMAPGGVQIWGRKGATGVFANLALVDGGDAAITLEGFKPTETWQFKVRVQSPASKYSAYSNVVSILMPKNDPPPLPPSKPTGTTRLGTVAITWDGKAAGGVAMPVDIKHVKVQRCVRATFIPATDVTEVDQLALAGTAVDAPLKVGDSWFYRFIAIDNAGQDSQPSGVFGPIVVDGVKPLDLPLEAITPGMLTKEVNDIIGDAARKAGEAADAAKSAAKIFSQPPPAPTTGMKLGDLWFDTSVAGGNKPYRFASTAIKPLGEWISVRDLTLNNAFPTGSLLAENFLDKDVIHTKFLQAGLIEAKDILSGTITAESGVIGSIDAGTITAGLLDGKYIRAGTITATSIFLGDTNNLIDQPQFADIAAWMTAPQAGGIVTVADAPFVGAGKAYQIAGNGIARNVQNSRIIPVKPTEKFWSDCYVRKTATGSSGTVAIVLVVKIKNSPTPVIVTIGQRAFTTADPANSWFRISGREIEIPTDGYEASFALRIGASVVSGNFQFVAPVLRRQFTGSLVVDGSITADQIKGHTITADQILGHTITAGEIDAKTIRADSFIAGSITSNSAVIGSLNAAKITAGVMEGERIKAGTIVTTHMTANKIKGDRITSNTLNADKIVSGTITTGKLYSGHISATVLTAGSLKSDRIASGTIKGDRIAAGTIKSDRIYASTIKGDRIAGGEIRAGHLATNSVIAAKILADNVTGSKMHAHAIDAMTVTGATLRTASSGRRVQIDKSGLHLYGSGSTALIAMGATTTSFYIRSAATGSRFVIDNQGIRLYQGGTNTVNLTNSGNATIKGTMTAGSYFRSGTIVGGAHSGTISGGTMSGATWSGGGFSGTVNNNGTIQGGTFRSANSSTRIDIIYDQIQFVTGGNLVGTIRPRSDRTGIQIAAAGSGSRTWLGSGGAFYVSNNTTVYSPGIYANNSSGGNAVYIAANGFLTKHTSSQRYKLKIKDLDLAPEFMDIRTATWLDKPNLATMEQRVMARGTPRFTGFIAENMHKIGLTDAVAYDRMARPDTINVPAVLAHTVRYVQDLVRRVDELTERVATLEGAQ